MAYVVVAARRSWTLPSKETWGQGVVIVDEPTTPVPVGGSITFSCGQGFVPLQEGAVEGTIFCDNGGWWPSEDMVLAAMPVCAPGGF